MNGEVKAHLTSKDFLVGLEWVLNAAKNQANNTSMPNETLTGAADYYQKTSDMGDAAAELTYQDMLDAGVGVEAPDDYTLVFTCKDPCPYFDTVAAYTSFYPASEDLINELKNEYTIVIVTHNMQQAARIADYTAFFNLKAVGQPGHLEYFTDTTTMFNNPQNEEAERYVSGRFG